MLLSRRSKVCLGVAGVFVVMATLVGLGSGGQIVKLKASDITRPREKEWGDVAITTVRYVDAVETQIPAVEKGSEGIESAEEVTGDDVQDAGDTSEDVEEGPEEELLEEPPSESEDLYSAHQKDVTELSEDELKQELEWARSGNRAPEPAKSHPENPLQGTSLDNENKTNPEEAPLPDGYVGKMTHRYSPYEQTRVVKKSYGNTDKIPRATLFTLVKNSELYGILGSIQQLEARFNHRMNYDWVFVNDVPFSDKFIELTSALVSGTARYGIIPHEHWSYPEWIDQKRAKAVRESRKYASVVYGSSESYRHMCRYNSKFFYHHPIMDDYELYWRVEPDVSFMCDILQDPFRYMAETNTQYGFTIAFTEFYRTVETLWPTCKDYFGRPEVQAQLPGGEDDLTEFISDDKGKSYNLCHFWTNFEIANLTFWKSPLYEEYVDHLDHAGGFFYERWGDAPVHSIAVAKMLTGSQVHEFTDISYKHTVAGTCPLDDELLKKAHCTCDPLKDWMLTSSQRCNWKFHKASRQPKAKDFNKYFNLIRLDKLHQEKEKARKHSLREEAARRKRVERKKQSDAKKQEYEERRKKLLEGS